MDKLDIVYQQGNYAVNKTGYNCIIYQILMSVSRSGLYIDLDASEGVFVELDNAINKVKELANG